MWAKEISERAHVGTTTPQGAPAHLVHPPSVISAPKILKYSGKNHIKFSGHSENFYFWVIKFRKQTKHGILFYLTNKNRKQKVGTKSSAY